MFTALRPVLGLLLLAGPVAAQTAPTQHADLDRPHDTGWVVNTGIKGEIVDSFTVEAKGHDWLRLEFERLDLPRGTELWITSWKDGDVQVLDAQGALEWENTSCYFNGDTVQVEIWSEPGADPARVQLRGIDAGLPQPQGSICGPTDDRVSSTDSRVARMLPVGCTGWLIADCAGCYLTAGHCTGNIQVAQFNVPQSNSNGSLNHPPASDQYPVDSSSLQSNGGQGVGNDWAVFGTFANTNTGQHAVDVQGPGFNLATSIPGTSGNSIRITGYGTDGGSANQTQQTHVGPFVNNGGTAVGYVTDTTGGNSGSPVIHEQTGNAVGIHTHGGCGSGGGNNWGTQITRSDLQNAINSPLGICASNCTGADCSTPDALEPNQACGSGAVVQDGGYPDLNAELGDPDYYSFGVAAGATVAISVLHAVSDADLDAFLYAANACNGTTGDPGCAGSLACGYTSTDDEVLTWTNTTGGQVDCTLRVSVWPNSAGACAEYDLVVFGVTTPGGGGGGTVSAFCDPGQLNSTGFPATLAGSFIGPALHLEAFSGPDNQFGYVVVSGSTNAGVPISQGLLCLGSPIGRYNAAAGPGRNSLGQFQSGVFVNLSGTSSLGTGFDVPSTLPGPINGTIAAGQTWNFQLWYRDLGNSSNFTNGLAAQF
jgi:V8-like Glu-specific endopeptidase